MSSSNTSTHDIDSLTIVRDGKLREMLGGISGVTLWRMANDPSIGLPPKVQVSKGIAGRRLSDLKIWFERRSAAR